MASRAITAESQTGKLVEFLNIECSAVMLVDHNHKVDKNAPTTTYRYVSKALYTWSKDRWRNYEVELGPHMHYQEPFFYGFWLRIVVKTSGSDRQ